MKKILLVVCLTIAVAALLALPACAPAYTIKYTYKPGIGYYLTDGKDMALYYFSRDIQGTPYAGPEAFAPVTVLPTGLSSIPTRSSSPGLSTPPTSPRLPGKTESSS